MTAVDHAPSEAIPTTTAIEVLVVDKSPIASDIVSLTLRSPDGSRLPPWSPGSHIDLHLGENLVRQYSLCSSPEDLRQYQVAVLHERDGRGGSRYVHEALASGRRLTVSAPRNNFPLHTGDDHLLIAGGVGITPMLPMIEHLHRLELPWTLVYGGRSLDSMAFVDLLEKFDEHVEIVPQDRYGLIDIESAFDRFTDATKVQHIYCCGPESLLTAVEASASRRPGTTLHTERFTAQAVDTSADRPFDVHLARSGRTLRVATDRSILEAVEDAGIFLTSSCREGVCGTCEVGVVAGTPEHRDSVLTDDEKAAADCMMICVSRAAGPSLTIDL